MNGQKWTQNNGGQKHNKVLLDPIEVVLLMAAARVMRERCVGVGRHRGGS